MEIDVKKADEPYEVEWENMGYTRIERNVRKFISIIASFLLIAITFGIIVGDKELFAKMKKIF